MKKKLIASVLLAVMLVCSIGVHASVEYSGAFAQDVLRNLDIMKGDENGNMNLGSSLTRAEFAKIAINSSKYKNSVAHGAKISVFQDCTYTHWAAPYVKVAVTNKVVTGYPDGTFKPDNTVSLEEAVTVMLRLLGYADEDFGNTWPYGQVSLAEGIGLTDNIEKGIGEAMSREDALKMVYNTLNAKVKDSDREYCGEIDVSLHADAIIIATSAEDSSVSYGNVLTSAGTFRCDDYISDYVGLKGFLAVKSSGEVICFTPSDKNTVSEYIVYSVLSNSIIAYHDGAMTELKLSDGTPVYSGAEKLTFASAKSDVEIGDVICAVTSKNGSVDYLTLTKDSLDGPHVLYSYTDNWYSRFTSDFANLTLVRNGEKVSLSSAKAYDVLYYSKELNTVFAYAKTVTGVYEEAIPNKEAPTSVVVSGTQYDIESVEAFSKLSSSGNLAYGSSVTLLLGKDSKIAEVLSSDKALGASETVGYLTEIGKKQFEKNGEPYTSRYVKLIMPDGTTAEYKTDADYSSLINKVVRVTFSGENAKLTVESASGLSGRVNAGAMTIGRNVVANDVQILDVSTTRLNYKGTAVKTYMVRLDGVNLSSSNVLWYKKNTSGEINRIILKDVTGDSSKYGIVTEINESSSASGLSVSGSYTIDSMGTQYRYSGGLFANLTYIAPVKLVVSGTEVQTLSALKKLSGKISSLTGYSIAVGGTEYLLSDDVIVYNKISDRNYGVMPLSELLDCYEDYSISVYSDKAQSLGGRVRILIVQKS